MGSVNSRSRAPQPAPVQQVIYQQPEPEEVTSTSKTDEEISAEARTDSLLRRTRGRFGTILTGFRGILESKDNEQKTRKTLLGE